MRSCGRGDEPSRSGATEIVQYGYEVLPITLKNNVQYVENAKRNIWMYCNRNSEKIIKLGAS
jgi:hypothetical protein